jgi:hypothetical protein
MPSFSLPTKIISSSKLSGFCTGNNTKEKKKKRKKEKRKKKKKKNPSFL